MKSHNNYRLTFLILIFLYPAVTFFSQSVTKVLISGMGGSHDENVQTAFELGYESYNGTEFTGTITQYVDYGIDNTFTYAEDNGYELIVRSTTGLAYAITKAEEYSDIQIVMPAGSNSYVYVYSGDIESCPVIITGAGDDCNETGYKVEFYGPDPITGEPDYSSYSNGYIAGQIAYIANSQNLTIQKARLEARKTIQGDSGPDIYDGYGAIDIETVLNNVLPVELLSFTAEISANQVNLCWSTATEVNNYGFEIERASSSTSPVWEWETIGFVRGHGNSNSQKNYSFTDANPPAGDIQYRLKQIDTDGSYEYYSTLAEINNVVTSLNENNNEVPIEFNLYQNYPNPFNPETTIKFAISSGNEGSIHTILKVYSILGEDIATLVNDERDAGIYEIRFNAENLSSGIYFYTLQAGEYKQTRKFILTK